MTDAEIYGRNRAALEGRNARILPLLRFLPAWEGGGFDRARSGDPIPFLRGQAGKISLHSSVQPRTEAARLRAAWPESGYFACLGLAGGYLAAEILRSPACERLLCVEHSPDFLSFCLSRMDLSPILSDPRFRLLLDPQGADLEAELLGSYLPQVSGSFSLLALHARTEADKASFEKDAQAIRSALESVSADLSVQARFGRRWFANTLRNLRAAAAPSPDGPRTERALVTAAGPSLEDAMGELRSLQSAGWLLVATDTSLPALLAAGIMPGAVISIDCQQYSCQHFLRGLPEDLPLFLDLASPPALSRLAPRPRFFASAHPLASCLRRRWKDFPFLDCSGGNVSQAALSLAEALGAREIRLYGADFSYPRGRAYARGTWLHDWFSFRASRLDPLEAQFSRFIHRGTDLRSEEDASGFRYRTAQLDAYRENLEAFLPTMGSRVVAVRGGGVEIRLAESRAGAERARPAFGATEAARMEAGDFLRIFARELSSLSLGPGAILPALEALDAPGREAWASVLPAAAWRSPADQASPWGRDALQRARLWCAEEAQALAAELM